MRGVRVVPPAHLDDCPLLDYPFIWRKRLADDVVSVLFVHRERSRRLVRQQNVAENAGALYVKAGVLRGLPVDAVERILETGGVLHDHFFDFAFVDAGERADRRDVFRFFRRSEPVDAV